MEVHITVLSFFLLISLVTVQGIYKGSNADEDRYTWMAGVYIDDTFVGNGVLVNKRWVLTATSLVQSVTNVSSVTVMLGDYNRKLNEGEEVSLTITNITAYPDHSEGDVDLSMLQLESVANPGTYGSGVKNVKQLATQGMVDKLMDTIDQYRKICYVTGWGKALKDNKWYLPGKLQELEVKPITETMCNNRVTDANYNTSLCFHSTRTYVGSKMGGTACLQDEGSPIVCYVNRYWTLFGVYSYKYLNEDGCFRGPMVSTSIAKYRDWIRSFWVADDNILQPSK